MVVARDWGGGGENRELFIGREFPFYKMQRVMGMLSGEGC